MSKNLESKGYQKVKEIYAKLKEVAELQKTKDFGLFDSQIPEHVHRIITNQQIRLMNELESIPQEIELKFPGGGSYGDSDD